MTQKQSINLPFTLQHDDDGETTVIDKFNNEVCQVFAPDIEREAMGDIIVRACNSHYELLEALVLAREAMRRAFSPTLISHHTDQSKASDLLENAIVRAQQVLAKAGTL